MLELMEKGQWKSIDQKFHIGHAKLLGEIPVGSWGWRQQEPGRVLPLAVTGV